MNTKRILAALALAALTACGGGQTDYERCVEQSTFVGPVQPGTAWPGCAGLDGAP